MRLFIAIKCSEKLNGLVFKSGSVLKNFGIIKPVAMENLHVTLIFLGEQNEESKEKIINCMKDINFKERIVIDFKRFNYFKNKGLPSVFFLEGESYSLNSFTDKLRVKLKEEKISFENRKKFIIHLTIARIKTLKDKEGFKDYVIKLNENFSDYREYIENVYLFKSTLTKNGPYYEQLYVKKL